MNASNFRSTVSSLVLSFAALAATLPAHAAVDCATPRGIEQRRACEAAAQGAQSLRRFSERTRMIYAINVRDYVVAQSPVAAKPESEHKQLARAR